MDGHVRRGEVAVGEVVVAELPRQAPAAEEDALPDARDEDEAQIKRWS